MKPRRKCSTGVAAELEKIRFKASVDRGLRQAERGETTPHDEFLDRFKGRAIELNKP